MFKWPEAPSARAGAHELADFAELTAWREGAASALALSRALNRLDENDYADGVPEDDRTEPGIASAYEELERRQIACGPGNSYPFEIDRSGNTLRAANRAPGWRQDIYRYLLLATRLNMGRQRMQAGRDGTALFEKLSAEVAREYLGERAESLVFGTAADQADFPGKIDRLCGRIGEGDGFEKLDGVSANRKDGKLDVVAWKPFSDNMKGKLVVFGQCKTGTAYKESLTALRPDEFCRKWLKSQPVLNPVRLFFVSESLARGNWPGESFDAGLIFDRCRIVDFCGRIDDRVLGDIRAWTSAAATDNGLPLPSRV